MHLSRVGMQYQCFSVNRSVPAVNHANGTPAEGLRNMLEESARIARGNIKSISEMKPELYDALFIPGGFGIAKNFSNFASAGDKMEVDPEVAKAIWEFFHAKKPIGACCIAPVILARIFGTVSGKSGLDITLGKKGPEWPYAGSIEVANKYGNKLVDCDIDDICKDRYNNVVTTPAYMKENAKPHEVFDGIKKMVDEVISYI